MTNPALKNNNKKKAFYLHCHLKDEMHHTETCQVFILTKWKSCWLWGESPLHIHTLEHQRSQGQRHLFFKRPVKASGQRLTLRAIKYMNGTLCPAVAWNLECQNLTTNGAQWVLAAGLASCILCLFSVCCLLGFKYSLPLESLQDWN